MDFADNCFGLTAVDEDVIFNFDDYRIDTARFEIARCGRPIAVEPQVLELLIVLINQRDRVVSKDELLDTVWKGRVVSETTLSSRIKTARQVIGDDGARQNLIRTIHGRGFRFVGEVDIEVGSLEPSAKPAAPLTDRPLTHYARSGDIHIAYQVFGNGPVNLILAPGFISHVERYWDNAVWALCLRRLGRLARVAVFDKRGTGLSDRVTSLPALDERMDDLRAVMDAARFESAFVMGISEGGSMAALFAACHPTRCDALILYGAFAQFKHWFPDEASLQRLYDYIESDWGSGKSLARFAPTAADDAEFLRWWGTFERLGATPGSAIALMQMNSRIDISDVLPTIHVPTLVMQVANDTLIDPQAGHDLAAGIPGARYVQWPGVDHLPMIEPNASRIVDEVAKFIEQRGARRRPTDRVLAAILLLECQGDSATVQAQLERFRATRICPRADGLASIFDGPGRALEAALSASRLLRAQGVRHRIAVHTGEIGIESADLHGTTLDIARDVIAYAEADEILASRTVADLVAGSGIALEDRGEVALAAVGQAWHLYRVAP